MLKRALYAMPDDIRDALIDNDVMGQYDARPPYQRNDYITWIERAKRPATRQKRLAQMIDELKTADRYMKMKYRARKTPLTG